MHRGFIKLWRKSLDSTIWQNPNLWRVWTWCLLKATHTERTGKVGYQDIQLLPGQFITGRMKASEETGLSEREFRTALDSLRKSQNVTIKTTNKYSIITIVNWTEYQDEPTSKMSNERPANVQQTTTDKNVKNDKNISPPIIPQNAFQFFGTHYQNLTDKTADILKDAIEVYSEEWVMDALKEGYEREKCNWKYVEVILQRWAKEGRGNGKSGRIPKVYHTIEEVVREQQGHVEPEEESEVQS